jgi:hypothetical protein
VSKTAEALSGRWSSSWGETTIEVKGDAVSGSWPDGTFSGSAADGTLTLTWAHKDGTAGKASLKADADFAKLSGTWGWDTDADGGAWDLTQTASTAPAAPAADAAAGEAPPADAGAEAPPADDKKPKKK